MSSARKYDVALSFAGEDRKYADDLARLLQAAGLSVFYDLFEQHTLWGKDLYSYLAEIYRDQARFVVLFASESYVRKAWTKHERMHAQARAFSQDDEYILPLRIDDTAIPGIPETMGFIDLRQHTISEVVTLIERKLGRGVRSADSAMVRPPSGQTSKAATQRARIPLPTVRRTPTDLDIRRAIKDAFAAVRTYFHQASELLTEADSNFHGEFTEAGTLDFDFELFHQGRLMKAARIWVGDDLGSNSICYYDGPRGLTRGSMNEFCTAGTTDNGEIKFRSGMGSALGRRSDALMSDNEVAEYYWTRVIEGIE